MKQIYLDYNASTPIAPEVRAAMLPYLEMDYGNPSALHFASVGAKKAVEQARGQVADLIGCSASEVIFTSGGSESNNHVLKGVWQTFRHRGNHIITTSIEHPAIINPCKYLEQQGAKVTYVGVDETGKVNPIEIANAITQETILLSVMHSNNEVGTIQPIKEIGEIAKQHQILFHTDASQSVGKVPIDVNELGVDFLTIAGHKVYAPKGVGALFIRDGIDLEPFIHGAGHEGGKRAGTENVIFTVALGKACEIAKDQMLENERIENLRNSFWEGLQALFGDQISLNGDLANCLPNTLSVNFKDRIGQDVLGAIPSIAASNGSACHAGSVTLSNVLKAMSVKEEEGKGAIRFSLGRYTTKEEIEMALEMLQRAIRN